MRSPASRSPTGKSPTSYPASLSEAKTFSSDSGTFSSAAVPVAPTPGGNPYRMMPIFFSEACFLRSETQLLTLPASRATRSGTK